MKTACITTTVNENYAAFAPIFAYCAKRAYPEYDCEVFYVNATPFNAATLRFVHGEDKLSQYDYCLITDADIIIKREMPVFANQHVSHMLANGLICYDNCDHGDHMPGIHFVTREWWSKTRLAREKVLDKITREPATRAQDEQFLWQIVKDSGLPMSKHPLLWATHGLHLGRFRGKGINAVRFQPNEFEFLASLAGDSVFMGLIDEAIAKSSLVAGVWKNVMALYNKRCGQ